MTCIECKTVIPADSRFCLRCGATQPTHELLEASAWGSATSHPESGLVCRECGGERVNAEVDFVLKKTFPYRENNTFSSTVRALVCRSCGLTTLYATTPEFFSGKSDEQISGLKLKRQLIELAEQIFENKAGRVIALLEQASPDIPTLRVYCDQARRVGQMFIGPNQANTFYQRAIELIEQDI